MYAHFECSHNQNESLVWPFKCTKTRRCINAINHMNFKHYGLLHDKISKINESQSLLEMRPNFLTVSNCVCQMKCEFKMGQLGRGHDFRLDTKSIFVTCSSRLFIQSHQCVCKPKSDDLCLKLQQRAKGELNTTIDQTIFKSNTIVYMANSSSFRICTKTKRQPKLLS